LEIYAISICKENEVNYENTIKRIMGSLHECRLEALSQVMNLSLPEKRKEHIRLQGNLRQFIVNKVHAWLHNKKPILTAFKLEANPVRECVHFVRPVEDPFGFIDRVIENGCTPLREGELLDFLMLCKYRSTATYICIDSRCGNPKYQYSCSYGVLVTKK